ncbi:MAG TPA: cytochrome c [Miltoncostaeaceae bacterium]|nr:cytochrome c [Miltoncostaeaceae bacterium]
MRKLKRTVAVVAIAALAGSGVLAGCNESDSSEAQTPANAPTVENTAVQTDEEGNTIEAPGGQTGGEGGENGETGGDNGQGEGDAGGEVGDVAAGQSTFEGVCQGCHAQGGQQAAVGPKLAEAGLAEDEIRNTIVNGQGVMPAGLVQGEDQDNVVAYVLSIQ